MLSVCLCICFKINLFVVFFLETKKKVTKYNCIKYRTIYKKEKLIQYITYLYSTEKTERERKR